MTPFGLVEWVHRRRSAHTQLWRGIYDHYRDVPKRGEGYESDAWISTRVKMTEMAKLAAEQSGPIPPLMDSRYLLLPFLVASLVRTGGKISVLDFGGAMGVAYPYCVATLGRRDTVEYYVVDNRRSCLEGRRIFSSDSRIRFCTELEQVPKADIVYVSGTLEYIEDCRGILKRLVRRFQPQVILLALTSVGNFQTYASAQINLENIVIPAWFFNFHGLSSILTDLGYHLEFKSASELAFDMGNFPETHRFKHMAHLLFKKLSCPA